MDLIERQAAIDAIRKLESGEDFNFNNGLICAMNNIDELPSAQTTEASCWGCNCPKMERLKEQKTFSEMVHLHDAETHEERTETHGVCLDTISRQMAIDAFKKELTVGESKGNYVTLCSAVSYEGAKQILESLPSAQPEPQWIPCKTRLPEDEGTYIVTDVDGDVEIAWYQEDWRDDKEVMAWFLDEYGWIEVLAWMPLPEPYKEGDNERA